MIIGQDNSNVPNVIKLFADAFAKSSIEVNSVVGQRMVFILQEFQVSFFFLTLNIEIVTYSLIISLHNTSS